MAYTVDVTRGERRGELSHQWATRPDDERFLTLDALYAATDRAAQESYPEPSDANGIAAIPQADGKGLLFQIGGSDPVPASNIAFKQIALFAGAPAAFLEKLPAELAARNLNHGLMREITEDISRVAYIRRPRADGETNGLPGDPWTLASKNDFIRGFTSPKYGRIYDRDIVKALQKLVEHDPRWKVPGMIDWSSMQHDPDVAVTKESTTLYASDRDMFAFLCDDRNPVEIGKLRNGDPDMLFRGFYTGNSEIGVSRFTLALMYLRGICQNRNMWGVEGFTKLGIRHSKGAPQRFIEQAEPMLKKFAEGNTLALVEGVKAAKSTIVANDDEGREEFLRKLGFSKKKAGLIVDQHMLEEGSPPESIWDMAQGITASARYCTFQDKRVEMEKIAGDLLDKVAVAA